MPYALSRKPNLDSRRSRKNCSLCHLHGRNFTISFMVEKPSLKPTRSLLLQLSTSLFILRLESDSTVASCQPCNSGKPHQQKELLLVQPVPELLWSLVRADIFDWQSTQYLILVDSYSGGFEMIYLPKRLFRR